MRDTKEANITVGQALFPVVLLSLVVLIFMGFQSVLIVRDRDSIHDALTQQNKPIEDAGKLQAQFAALANGAHKLAEGGDKDAEALVERMKKAGIVFQDDTAAKPPAAGVAMPTSTP